MTDPEARLGAIATELERVTARLERAHDSRCVFTYAYAIMTRRIAADLRGQQAADADWIASLAEAFSKRYFAAIEAYDRGELVEGAWLTIFDALRNRRTSALEDLVFAMTGHIVHDLPLALGDVGPVPEQIFDFYRKRGMTLDFLSTGGLGCNEFIFSYAEAQHLSAVA